MFKVNSKYTRTTLLDVVLVSLLLTLKILYTPCSSVSIVDFEHVIGDWDTYFLEKQEFLKSAIIWQLNYPEFDTFSNFLISHAFKKICT